MYELFRHKHSHSYLQPPRDQPPTCCCIRHSTPLGRCQLPLAAALPTAPGCCNSSTSRATDDRPPLPSRRSAQRGSGASNTNIDGGLQQPQTLWQCHQSRQHHHQHPSVMQATPWTPRFVRSGRSRTGHSLRATDEPLRAPPACPHAGGGGLAAAAPALPRAEQGLCAADCRGEQLKWGVGHRVGLCI